MLISNESSRDQKEKYSFQTIIYVHDNFRFVFRFSTGRKERGEGKGKQEKEVMSERKEGGKRKTGNCMRETRKMSP